MKRIINYFIQGLLLLVPTGLTIWLIYISFTYLDGLTKPLEHKYIGSEIPGLGLLIMVLLIFLAGFLSSTIIFRPLTALFERFVNRAPLIKDIYSAIQDLLSAFVGNKKKFNQPVLVQMNSTGLRRIGFITRQGLEEMGIDDNHVVVYLPYSYGLMGTVIVVKKEMVEAISLSATDTMKFIVSGSVTEVDEIEKE